jgi:hypothetical protein
LGIVAKHLASASPLTQDKELAHLPWDSRRDTPVAEQQVALVPERETKKTAHRSASIVQVCSAPAEVVGREPIDLPI